MTARWIELRQRKQALSPYSREAEVRTLDLLESALLPTGGQDVDPVIQAKLREAASRDIEELRPHLDRRATELAEKARVDLAKRAEQEATAMRKILEEQQKRVAETAGKYKDPQLILDFNDDEQRQLESNKRHWEKRLRDRPGTCLRARTHPGALRGQGPADRARRPGLSLADVGVRWNHGQKPGTADAH